MTPCEKYGHDCRNCDSNFEDSEAALRTQLAEAQDQVQALTWELEGERRNAAWEAERAVKAVDDLASQSATLSRLREALVEIEDTASGICGTASDHESAREIRSQVRAALSMLDPVASEPIESQRDIRQRRVHGWCAAAFGAGHAASIPQRGIRHAEEAIEAAQAAGCDQAMVHKLVDHIYSKEPGKLHQEIGGSGITLLALAQAAGLSADAEEVREMERVLAKPMEHFAARNKVKNDAGFNLAADPKVE